MREFSHSQKPGGGTGEAGNLPLDYSHNPLLVIVSFAIALMAISVGPDFLAFVGSRRKFGALRAKLAGNGADPQALDAVVAPAGHDIGAATPEEIALSILSQIVAHRRRGDK